MTGPTEESVEGALRDALARGDVMLASARPILRHLTASEDRSLFNDEVVARVRGMMLSLAEQLLAALAERAAVKDRAAFLARHREGLAEALGEDAALIGHAHALAVEGQLAERLQARSGIDAVLPPLLQQLSESTEPAAAELAMAVVAAQARSVQQFRRMELRLTELPGEQFHSALETLRVFSRSDDPAVEATLQALRSEYSEADGRIGLIGQLVSQLGRDVAGALLLDQVGLAVFASALAVGAELSRDDVLLALTERQVARLALAMRAAGLEQRAIEAQLLLIHPGLALPAGFEMLRSERAAALLAGSRAAPAAAV